MSVEEMITLQELLPGRDNERTRNKLTELIVNKRQELGAFKENAHEESVKTSNKNNSTYKFNSDTDVESKVNEKQYMVLENHKKARMYNDEGTNRYKVEHKQDFEKLSNYSDKTGTKFRLTYNYKEEFGNEGYGHREQDGTIVLNANQPSEVIKATALHETVHHMIETSPDEAREFLDAVRDVTDSTDNKKIKKKIEESYKKVYEDGEINEEYACQIAGQLFETDTKVFEDTLKGSTTKYKSAVARFLSKFKEIFNSITGKYDIKDRRTGYSWQATGDQLHRLTTTFEKW